MVRTYTVRWTDAEGRPRQHASISRDEHVEFLSMLYDQGLIGPAAPKPNRFVVIEGRRK